MGVYWRIVKRGQNLIYSAEDGGNEERVGGYRETKRGIDAYAATFGYEPGRSQKDFDTIENAKAFVESFRPWELYGAEGLTVDPEVRPALDSDSDGSADAPAQPEDTVTPDQPAEVAAPDQTEEIVAPDQPEAIAAPEQPAEIVAPDRPEAVAAQEQPTQRAAPEQSPQYMAPESKPSKSWWQFWKSS